MILFYKFLGMKKKLLSVLVLFLATLLVAGCVNNPVIEDDLGGNDVIEDDVIIDEEIMPEPEEEIIEEEIVEEEIVEDVFVE
ncbi:MAG TPA: hypothetical protein PKX34_02970 [Candidatus Absconditabacterales bacterium]|nr:hypothetical protein [Candidatus Absconditabacterales bacterium]HPK28149.1 hypothetical protein [Candidatus Absconditabacterales bacterium]